MGYQRSVNMTPGTAEQNKGKQREELAGAEIIRLMMHLPPPSSTPMNIAPSGNFCVLEGRMLQRLQHR